MFITKQNKFLIPLYANYNICVSVNPDFARTVEARDYKGFGTSVQTQTCVLEINEKSRCDKYKTE